ncbi:uncharacterized protein EV154DRAFT_580083 [Mucor mucedo]|uniref:uncharacterized protein n=1 Tax=Mucor mucedo TaxID=29922 RepID=UPI00221FDDA2|nr:uncharacterized protein EV154DRAFT_580083 [Mucor mucedo]KAI7872239.1 hypothetical protein EV154DRAFT_580083 [Mucor mucedo]
MATLWAGIRNNFRENFATNQAAVLVDRDDDSFYTRWKTIQKLVLKYTSFYDQVQNGPSPSGSGPNEMIDRADVLFEKDVEPKFKSMLEVSAIKAKGKRKAINSLAVENDVDEVRPIGRKKEKRLASGEGLKAASESRSAKNIELLLECNRERIRLLQMTREDEIMKKNIYSVDDLDYRELLIAQKKRILARMWEEERRLQKESESSLLREAEKDEDWSDVEVPEEVREGVEAGGDEVGEKEEVDEEVD